VRHDSHAPAGAAFAVASPLPAHVPHDSSPSRFRQPRPRWLAALCAASLITGAVCPPAIAQINLPALGDTESEDFGIGTERKLGDQVMREIRRDPDYLDDPVLLEYVESLWEPLLAQARGNGNITADLDQRFAWEPFLVRDRAINAFALPGGYVGVYLGLVALTTSRDELASVLAHELSHVTQRHISRSIAVGKRQSLIGAAAMILGVLAAARSNSIDAANALIVGGQAAAIQGQLNFSRDMEREADRIGFSLLTGAGYSAAGMAAMFEKLDQSSRLNDNGAYPYLRSHPLSSERIGEARARLGTAPAALPGGDFEHALAQGRARVLMDPRVDALRRWQALDPDRPGASPAERLGAAYSSALASTLLRDWARADAALTRAIGLTGENTRDPRVARMVGLLTAQSLFERGDAVRAAAALKPFADGASRPAMLLEAQVALAIAARAPGEATSATALKRSADRLQTWLALRPRDAAAWAQLGQAWAQLGQPLRALRAEAEVRLALGDLNGAADRLRAGQRSARSGTGVDFIDASVIDARLRYVEGQRRQIAIDERAAQEPR
jgi:beta-barrel assembly-enhancing protease